VKKKLNNTGIHSMACRPLYSRASTVMSRTSSQPFTPPRRTPQGQAAIINRNGEDAMHPSELLNRSRQPEGSTVASTAGRRCAAASSQRQSSPSPSIAPNLCCRLSHESASRSPLSALRRRTPAPASKLTALPVS